MTLSQTQVQIRLQLLTKSRFHFHSPNSLSLSLIRSHKQRTHTQIRIHTQGYGTHYIDLWCGSPPQRQTVIVDTGSGVTAFPCSGCNDCGVPDFHIDRLFVESESNTFAPSTCSAKSDCIMARSNCNNRSCKIGMSYAEGSRWNAYEAVDKCYVGGPHETPLIGTDSSSGASGSGGDDMDPDHAADLAFDMTFGCQTLVTGLFKTQLADGIMGMSNQASTFWSQMFRANKMGPDQHFSLCFSRPQDITKEGTEAGAMTLGGTDTRLHKTPMVYTPHADQGRSSFFSVKVRKFMLREGQYGESAKSTDANPNKGVQVLNLDEATINKGGIIVDSGTTDTYWTSGIATEFKRVFQKIAGRPYNNSPIKLTKNEFLALPTILLQLYSDDETNDLADIGNNDKFHTPGLAGSMDPQHPSDVIVAIPPSHYYEYNPDKGTYTGRFYPTERSGSVLGANAMMGHDVFFDVDNSRIGWAESDCDYTQTVKENGYEFEITGNLKKRARVVGNKHSTNNDSNDSNQCYTITSGNKCQKTEGCTWGWGKCTPLKSDLDPTESPTYFPTMVDEGSGDEDAEAVKEQTKKQYDPSSHDQQIIDIDALVKQANQHQVEILVFSIVAMLLLCCCCYCLCCGSSKKSLRKGPKYSREPTIKMEMTSGFQDGPEDDDDDDDDIDEEEEEDKARRTWGCSRNARNDMVVVSEDSVW